MGSFSMSTKWWCSKAFYTIGIREKSDSLECLISPHLESHGYYGFIQIENLRYWCDSDSLKNIEKTFCSIWMDLGFVNTMSCKMQTVHIQILGDPVYYWY